MPTDTGDARLIELFEQAIDQPPDQRADWAWRACGDDLELLERLLRLIDADVDTHDRLAEVVLAGTMRLEDSGADETGRILGPWRVIGELGRGGMGAVLLAERADDEYRRQVAIKLIRGFPDHDLLERLRAERQILADLDHPNIAGLLDGGSTEDGQPWLVMEYIDGYAIDRWCADRNAPLRERLRLMIELTRAVHHAHQRLVIHRDIKPGNVLVTADGTPKLLDFGIAKLVETAGAESEQTRLRYYTPHYSSPEQQSGQPVSTASDVFSLGRLLETVLNAGRIDPRLPAEAGAIVRRATAERPEDRYSSASALADDLKRWRDGRAVEALSKRRGYRMRRFVARHRVAVAASLAAAVVVSTLGWRTVEAGREARLAAATAEQTLAFLTGLIEAARPEFAQGREVTVAEVLERGGAQLDVARQASAGLRARIAATLASAWHALDEFPRAAALYARAAAEAADADDGVAALRARAKRLVVETRAGRVREIAPEAEALRADLDRLDPDDPALRADLLNDWSVWAIGAGQVEAAREVLLEVITLRRNLGEEATLASAEHNLALAEDQLGNIEAALDLVESSLARKRRVLGPDHPSTLVGLRVLAVTAARAGQYARASEALDELLNQRIHLFGADNPVLADDYNERANRVHDAGDYRRARELYRKALDLDAQQNNQPGRHVYLNNLAALHEDLGDYARAEALLLESLALREQRFGAEHSNTLRARHNLARLMLRQGRVEEARALAADTVDRSRTTLGPDHRDTRHTEWLLAWIDWRATPPAQRLPEALIGASDAVLADTAATGLRGLAVRTLKAQVLIESGRYDPARAELESLIADYRANFGAGHINAAELELELARIDHRIGTPNAAASRLDRAGPIVERALAPDAPARVLLACLRANPHDSPTAC